MKVSRRVPVRKRWVPFQGQPHARKARPCLMVIFEQECVSHPYGNTGVQNLLSQNKVKPSYSEAEKEDGIV